MKFFKVSKRDLTNILKNRFIRVSVIAVIIVPLLYSLLYLAAFWDPYSRLDKLPVAVVNLDKGGTKDGVPIKLGNDLTNKMRESNQLGFNFKSKSDAEDGLKGKKYYAEFIIPEDFSQKMLSGKDGIPKQPKIIYHTNMKKNFLASQIINAGKKELEAEITKNMTAIYTKAAFDNLFALKDGMNQAADGSKQIKDAIGTLNGYVPELKSKASQLNDGVNTLNSGLLTAKNGGDALSGGLGQINSQVPALVKGISDASKASNSLVDGYKKVQPGANNLASGLQDSSVRVPKLTQGAKDLKSGTSDVSTGVDILINKVNTSQTTLQNAVSNYLMAYLRSYPIATLDPNMKAFLGTLSSLDVASKDPANVEQITKLKTGAKQVAAGATDLSNGVDQLAVGLNSAVVGSKQVSDGVNQLSDGTTKLNAGLVQLNGKAPTLAGGINQAYTSSTALASGLGNLNAGSSQLKDGVGTLITKVPTLEDGASKLVDGTTKLNAKLSDGSNQLNKSLVNDGTAMSKFVSDSVEIKDDPINEVKNYGTGFAPYFISLSLYVGAMLMFFVITDKVDCDIKASNTSLVVGKFFSYGYIGIAQAILASIIVLVLGLKPNNLPLYFLFIIFISLVFIAINQCLVFLLGQTGRMIAIVLLILQLTAAGGTFPNELVPSFFKTINPAMPFTYTISGLREIISGTDYMILAKDLMVLLGMMVGFLIISVLFKGHANKVQKRLEDMKHNIVA